MSHKILNQAERDLAAIRLKADIEAGHETTRQIIAWRQGAIASHQAAAAKEKRARQNKRALWSLLLVFAGLYFWYWVQSPMGPLG
jgi:hypothetical protein